MRVTFDVETDGFLADLTVIHSLVIQDVDTKDMWSCTGTELNPRVVGRPDGTTHTYTTLEVGLGILEGADLIIGHNIIRFDIPAIQKVFPDFKPRGGVYDTVMVSRLMYPHLKQKDFAFRKKKKGANFPTSMIAQHRLEAWGMRLGVWKGDYFEQRKLAWVDDQGPRPSGGEPRADWDAGLARFAWGRWSVEMQDYCEQDVAVTTKLYFHLSLKEYCPEAIEMEHQFFEAMVQQETNGVCFDEERGRELYVELAGLRENLRQECMDLFPAWYAPGKVQFPKRTLNFKDPLRGSQIASYKDDEGTRWGQFQKIKLTSFNPGSRDHIIFWLKRKYQWEPTEFTDAGKPKVDDDVMQNLDYPEAPLLTRFLMIDKRISQLAEGKGAWLKSVTVDGRIHGQVDPLGTVTYRCSHKYPNLAQVPKVKAGKDGQPRKGLEGGYGYECRSLFFAPEGWVMVGADASGLELRCLAHFMGRYDGGAYRDELLSGDIHTANQRAAGIETRDDAKTFIYAFLYGAGNLKVGKIVRKGATAGAKLRARFLRNVPALNRLSTAVKHKAKSKWLMGLDGRPLLVRSAHSALNTLLQSAGAIVMKRALLIAIQDTLPDAGLETQRDYVLVLNVHDEVQAYVKPGKEVAFGEAVVEAIRRAGDYYNFRCPLDGEYKIGANWAETH